MFMSEVQRSLLRSTPVTTAAVKAAVSLRGMLMRGFTTVRDMGGGEYGMRDAAEAGIIESPRVFISGKALSQTGGHGDHRYRTEDDVGCGCGSGIEMFAVLADGVDEVIKAVREELRRGADQIKLMVSGGAGSPNDALESVQYREDEIAAAVEEATRWGTYVAVHAYANEAVLRSVRQGVRSIEHGNFLEKNSAQLMREKGAFLVPTLITYEYNRNLPGRSAYSLQKTELIRKVGGKSLELCRSEGVPIGYGTDLQFSGQHLQAEGLSLQGEILGRAETIRSATIVNARILHREGIVGELVPGAFADLLIVDGNPFEDFGCLQKKGGIVGIMKAGRFYKNEL